MTGRHDDDIDPRLADALRRALARGAADIQTAGDGLTKIRARTARARRQRWLVPIAAAASAVVVAGGVAWAAGTIGADDPDDLPVATSGATSTATSPPPTTGVIPTETEPPTTETATTPDASIPVYYLGAQPREGDAPPLYRGFREYHRVPLADPTDRAARVAAAVTEMFATAPLDDDYVSVWPTQAEVLEASVDEASGEVIVDLTGLDWAGAETPDGQPLDEFGAAVVQQLVFTATAAASRIAADDDFSATSVQVPRRWRPGRRDARRRRQWAVVAIADAIPGDHLDHRPRARRDRRHTDHGAPRGPSVRGRTGSWELRQDGEMVYEGQTTDRGRRPMGRVRVHDRRDVEPGTYELMVYDLGGLGDPRAAPRGLEDDHRPVVLRLRRASAVSQPRPEMIETRWNSPPSRPVRAPG